MSSTSPAQATTWAGVDRESVVEMRIVMESPETGLFEKVWTKGRVEPDHWARLLQIAETEAPSTEEDRLRSRHLGFSWVDRVQLDSGQVLELASPSHVDEMRASAGLSGR